MNITGLGRAKNSNGGIKSNLRDYGINSISPPTRGNSSEYVSLYNLSYKLLDMRMKHGSIGSIVTKP